MGDVIYALFLLFIIFNFPTIIGAIIGFGVGLIEVAVMSKEEEKYAEAEAAEAAGADAGANAGSQGGYYYGEYHYGGDYSGDSYKWYYGDDDEYEDTEGAYTTHTEDASVFFKGCQSKDDYQKRYKKLMLVYHPDGDTGNEEVAKQINAEYDRISATWEKQ